MSSGFFTIENRTIASLSHADVLQHSAVVVSAQKRFDKDVQVLSLDIDRGSFLHNSSVEATTHIVQTEHLLLSCTCSSAKNALCEHQSQLLLQLIDKPALRVFFDTKLRQNILKKTAMEYGLEQEEDLDSYFTLEYDPLGPKVKPLLQGLVKTSQSFLQQVKQQLGTTQSIIPYSNKTTASEKQIVVLSKHKYYDHLVVELYLAQSTKEGKLKSPLALANPQEYLWQSQEPDLLKFYMAIAKFQGTYVNSEHDIASLRALITNPLSLDFYHFNTKLSDKMSPAALLPIKLECLKPDLELTVDLKEKFYEIRAYINLQEKSYQLKDLQIKYEHFLMVGNIFYLIDQPELLKVIQFFKQNYHVILVHVSKYTDFQKEILSNLENKFKIRYSYIQRASATELEVQGFNVAPQRMIYLSDSEDYILITPVIKYGDREVPVFSQKQIFTVDILGNVLSVTRDEDLEARFAAFILRQHPYFQEQPLRESLYLHKSVFQEETWFVDTFQAWQDDDIKVLGFDKLKNSRVNPYKPNINISLGTGIKWFESTVQVQYGNQIVALKNLQKAVHNHAKFVELGDGTMGILPSQWLERFSQYFQAGTVVQDKIRMPKTKFEEILELYETEMLDKDAFAEIKKYKEAFKKFERIEETQVPDTLKATLRDYQKQGLNWLNFLDTFGFGGCLADDMGLGKTIQIIAFILLQREKKMHNTNLIVVPTSLIFNWQEEIEKFAPSIKVLTLHGSQRLQSIEEFAKYEVVLTTYGTLLSDIAWLKSYTFNYVFLDESQAIKNPDSQRYHAACLLQSYNRIVITGTPVENNTYDLYGQLSFACPGLLGTKLQFKGHYALPIDTFSDSKRAAELQRKVHPFVLRRTKKQVATELPEKTEMVIYCELGTEQRRIYDAYEKEFRDFLSHQKKEELFRQNMHVLQGFTKLRQICNAPALLKDEVFFTKDSAKIDVLMEQIESKAPQHKILVFSQFVSMLDLIKEELDTRNIAYEYLTGQTQNRAEKVHAFQNNTDIRVFLISLKAGGTGLNLTEADYVYLVDPWWNPAVENQAIDRSYRIGQSKHVVAVRLITPGTIEEKVMKLQHTKRDLATDLVKTDESILKTLSQNDLLALL